MHAVISLGWAIESQNTLALFANELRQAPLKTSVIDQISNRKIMQISMSVSKL